MKSDITSVLPAVSFVLVSLVLAALCVYGVSVP